MKRCRRPLILIALLLLVGAVVNVAVAWGIAASVQFQPWGPGTQPTPDWVVMPPGAVSDGDLAIVDEARGYRWARSYAAVHLPEDEGTVHLRVLTLCSGWPAQSLRAGWVFEHEWLPAPTRTTLGTFRAQAPPPRAVDVYSSPAARTIEGVMPAKFISRHGLFSQQAPLEAARVPMHPRLPAFLLNTLFYAAILALPLSVFPIRRRLRARRGRCPKCGYDLAGLGGADRGDEGAAPCPECGAALGRMKDEEPWIPDPLIL